MRLLFLSLALPLPANNGLKLRTWALVRALAAEGHEISLLTFADPAESMEVAPELRRLCREVEIVPLSLPSMSSPSNYGRLARSLLSGMPYAVERFRSPAMQARVGEHLRRRGVDAVFCETCYIAINLPGDMPAPLLLDNQNLEFLLLRRYAAQEANPIKRGYAWLESGKMRRWERANFVRSSLVMVCSGHDRKLAEGLADGRPVAVIPNVVDVGEYRPAAAEGSTLLYTGGMDWHPNRDAVEFFASSILPHLRRLGSDARLVVAGRSPAEAFRRRFAAIPEIQFTGAVPDMRVELARAAISVVPLRVGSGTRLKILEAAAMGKAVVSTTMGAEGLDFENGREILLADDPEEFARAVTGLLQDPERRRRVGLAARRKVEAQYSIEALCLALRNALATQGSGTAGAVDIRAGR